MPNIITRGNIPPQVTVIRSVISGGSADFNTPPLRFTGFFSDQLFASPGGAAGVTLRFYGSSASPVSTRRASLQHVNVATAGFIQAPNQNNWHSTAYTVDADHALYSVRLFQNDPLDPVDRDPVGNPAANPGPGAWWSLATFQRDWAMREPTTPGIQDTTAIWQMALTTDLATILAQTTIRIKYERT